MIFDELIGYPNWENGEIKALNEVMNEDEYSFIGFSNAQVAIVIK